MAHQEREARFLPPKHDRPRVDVASLPAAGVSCRHNLSTQDERRLKEGKVLLAVEADLALTSEDET